MLDDSIRKLSLDTIRIVADVLRTRSLTRVAQLSGMTQPAVSLHVRKFEKATNLQVVRRVGNQLVPSVHADYILSACQGILRSVAQIDDYSQLRANHRKRLGIDQEVFALLEHSTHDLTQLIEKYLLVVDSSDCLVKGFTDAHIDAVIRPLYLLEAKPELTFDVPFCWTGAARVGSSLPDFRANGKVPVIMQPRESPYGSLARAYLNNHTGNYDIVAETSDRATLCTLIERGLGYAYVPQSAASSYHRKLACNLPRVLRQTGTASFGIFYRKGEFSFADVEALFANIGSLATAGNAARELLNA